MDGIEERFLMLIANFLRELICHQGPGLCFYQTYEEESYMKLRFAASISGLSLLSSYWNRRTVA